MYRSRYIRTGCAALFVAVLLAATPANATDRPDDTAARLEQAKVMLESSAARLTAGQLDILSSTLSDALGSEHFGFQTSALRLVIQYGDQVEFGHGAVLDVVRLYRDHSDDRVRRMAVVALGAIGNEWSIDFLRRSLPYEQVDAVRHTVAAVVADHQS